MYFFRDLPLSAPFINFGMFFRSMCVFWGPSGDWGGDMFFAPRPLLASKTDSKEGFRG